MKSPNKDVLLTTPYREKGEEYEYWGSNVSGWIRYTYDKRNSNGLRFLKKNIPEIDILEFPSRKEYRRALKKDYDVLGFSFFTYQIPRILQMVEEAKKENDPELWAGNYGALTYGMEERFDKIFIGYSEEEVAKELGVEIDKLKHPMIVDYIGTPIGVRGFPLGILFTNRGCNQNCKFCQTPVFCSEPYKIPLPSIEEVIKNYKDAGVDEILIEDESFGMRKKHAEKVIDLLDKYDMNWYAMARVDILDNNLERWYQKGFSGTHVGIESLHQDSLDSVEKRIDVEKTLDLLERLEEKNAFMIGYYMIGFEEDTIPDIKESIKKLSEYSLDMLQICVVTPLPQTPLWDEISEKYGIIEEDWSKWDTKHLVWDHPNLTQREISDVLEWGFQEAYPRTKFIKSPTNFYLCRKDRFGHIKTQKKIIKDFILSNIGVDTKLADEKPEAGKRDTKESGSEISNVSDN
ncbi:MAG: radical SAM protein [Candidatus Thermoplasmatota archaeon]